MPGTVPARRGFTALELLVVLLVLSLLAATTVRYYFSRSEVTLENAAILLARDIRAAQHRSIFLGERSHLLFLPDGAGYVVTDAKGALASNPQTGEPFLRSYPDDGVFHGVTVREALSGGDCTLEIDERGGVLEDLTVTLTYEGDDRTVVLARETGVVTIVGSTSGWIDFDP
jgi:prepilin-type N-terminal cleavage/methylation domain-containing protein